MMILLIRRWKMTGIYERTSVVASLAYSSFHHFSIIIMMCKIATFRGFQQRYSSERRGRRLMITDVILVLVLQTTTSKLYIVSSNYAHCGVERKNCVSDLSV